MSWRVAESLETLRHQINTMAPGRDRSSDGTIGDEGHRARKSDHNPNDEGVVTALDITHDPAHGVDSGAIAEMLRLSRDPRIKYVISNRRIFSSKQSPWQWRPYDGANAHTKHVHVSVMGEKVLYDDTRAWALDQVAVVREPPRGLVSRRCTDITATVFGGRSDPNTSAYDEHFITDDELGVALPSRLTGARPKVRVTNPANGKSVVCDIVDVGPWNTNDPYWENGGRPQAETGMDRRGRRTNLAGIDLTPGAARAVGIDGKGKVDWEFVGAAEIPLPEEAPVVSIFERLRARIEEIERTLVRRAPEPTPPAGEDQIAVALQQILALVKSADGLKQTGGGTTAESRTESLRKLAEAINAVIGVASGGKTQPLGPVNGAFGETIGNLLNGKKSAIGIIGALLTSVLGNVPAGTGLGSVLSLLTPAAGIGIAGLSGYALPIFLAIAGWGALGKLEKWTQAKVPTTAGK